VTGSCDAPSSPTASASASLRSLAAPYSSREQTLLDGLQHRKCSRPVTTIDTALTPQSSPETSPISPSSSLSTKSSSFIRSTSRTSSTSSVSDVPSVAPVPSKALKANGQCTQLHPVLAACERRSKMSTRTVCATCMKAGYDYPKCAKCGEMWCSRVCRLRDGGKRHVCSKNG